MASIRFSIFVYAVILMLLLRVACSLQEEAEKVAVMSRDKIEKQSTKLFRHEKDRVSISVEVVVKRKILGMRKMAKKANKEHINGEELPSKMASFSSANPRNGDHKLTKRATKINHHHLHRHHRHDFEVKMSSNYMALNADYHVPRSHPPKNN